MKAMTMKTLVLTAALALLAGVASATTSGTTVTSGMNPFATVPATGYLSATVTNVNTTRAILPVTGKTMNSMVCTVRDTSGNLVPRSITVSGTGIFIASSGQASGTLAVGDRVNCFITYER